MTRCHKYKQYFIHIKLFEFTLDRKLTNVNVKSINKF